MTTYMWVLLLFNEKNMNITYTATVDKCSLAKWTVTQD